MKTNRPSFGQLILLLASLGLLLTACNTEEVKPTRMVIPTSEPTTASPTDIPTAEPTATQTPEPTATQTPEPTATAVPQISSAFTEADCEFDAPPGRDVTCGWLTVPEDRTDPTNDKSLRLHVAIFASESDNPAPDPIVYLEGGPGGDALETIPFVFEMRFAPYLANHTFIMFDQRGTGYSKPSLACPESAALSFELLEQDITPEEAAQQTTDTLLACRDRLVAEGVNLAAYNSVANAADLDDLRQALGYEQWNLLSVSYGTRLAQTTMRDHPAGLRSVILDSVYPLEVNLLTDTPASVARAFDVFFAGCAADPACAEAYPDLEDVFFDTVDQLNREKIILPVTHLLNGQSYQAYFRGDDLLGILFQSLYATEIIPDLPKLIYDVNAGEYTTLRALLSSLLVNTDFFSVGMQFSVQCHEENLFTNVGDVAAAAAVRPELEAIFKYSPNIGENTIAICEAWGVGLADPTENEPITSHIPTLILAGEYDPITPPAWGQQVSEHLENAYFYEFPGYGHGVSLTEGCGVTMVQSFLANPESKPDSLCLAELSGPAFTISGAAETLTLVPFENAVFGIAGVTPEGWEEAAPGVYTRGKGRLDQTVILQQAAPGVTADLLLGLLSSQLGWDEAPASTGTYEAANRTWTLYEVSAQGYPANIAVAEEDGTTLLILLISTPDEQAFLYDALFIPAMEALTVP